MKSTSLVVVIQASRLNSYKKPVAFVSIYVIRNAQLLKTTTSCAKIRTVMITCMLLGSRCSTGSRISLRGDQCQPYTLVNMIQNKKWNSKKRVHREGSLVPGAPSLISSNAMVLQSFTSISSGNSNSFLTFPWGLGGTSLKSVYLSGVLPC